MKRKFDSLFGCYIYNKRIAIVEPVFANLKNKGLSRFILRGKTKMSTQWKSFALVHNIENRPRDARVVARNRRDARFLLVPRG